MNTGYNAQRRIEELLDLTNKQMLELGELRTQAHRSGIIAKENGTLRAENAGLKAENERLRRSSRHPDDMIMLNQQQTKIIEQEQIIAAKDAEIERLKKDADAGLGRAVRAMPEGAGLYHMQPEVSGDGWCAKERDFANRGTTPEAALRAAGLMKGEGE